MMVGSTPSLKVVALGDSLTAGTQDGFTVQARQEHGWAQAMAKTAGLDWHAAYIDKDGIPLDVFVHGELDLGHTEERQKALKRWLTPLSLLTYYVGAPPWMPPVWKWAGQGGRAKDSQETKLHPQTNFAVPGFRSADLLDVAGARDMAQKVHSGVRDLDAMAQEVPLSKAILENGGHGHIHGTAVDRAIKADPDLVLLWAGSNDALHPMYAGYIDDRLLTPMHDQKLQYWDTDPITGKRSLKTTRHEVPGFETTWLGEHGLMDRLLHQTHADIAVMTVPEVTVVPALRPLGEKVGPLPYRVVLKDGTDITAKLENWVVPRGVLGPGKDGRTEFPPGTAAPVTTVLGAFLQSGELKSEHDLDAAMQTATQQGLLREDDVCDPDEQVQINFRVTQFNDVLRRAAALSPRVHLVDMNAVLQDTQKNGHHLRGAGPEDVMVTNTFTGVKDARGYDGMFSYDGLHPSDTGYAVVANAVLDQLKHDLAGNPRFAAITSSSEVDEKAAFAGDPHRADQRFVLVLDRPHLDAMTTLSH